MPRAARILSGVSLLVFLVGAFWLARLENAGPVRTEVVLSGDVPATVYLPAPGGRAASNSYFYDPPPRDARPPAVVAMHGFAGDRATLSGMARRLAESGYAVLLFDAKGHGANRNAFVRSRASGDAFDPEFAAAVEFLRGWPFVDGDRIAVLGHSMGAGAALDYATRDSGIDAAVLISGGWQLLGPYPPANALFLYASGDPERIRIRAAELASRLAGVASLPRGTTEGEPARRNAVRHAEIGGADHQGIVWTERAVAETVAWLDASLGVDAERNATPGDPRVALVALLALALLGVLPGLGFALSGVVPRAPSLPSDGRGLGLLAVALACAVPVPLLAFGSPAPILSASVLDKVAPHLALAGLLLLTLVWLRRPGLLRDCFVRPGATLLGAALALVALYMALAPFGPVVHRVTFTPERFVVFALATAGFLPFHLACNLLLRRGPVASATLFAVLGRLLVVLVLFAAVQLAGLDRVILFMLPALALASLAFEAFAAALYAGSRNLLAIALVDASWLALVVAAVVPVSL